MTGAGLFRRSRRRQRRGRRLRWFAAAGALAFAGLAVLAGVEVRTSRWQARYLGALGDELSFEVLPGPSDAIQFPGDGPYDRRLGYAQLGAFLDRVEAAGFEVEAQARSSARMLDLQDRGLFAIYDEKDRAGLEVLDRDGRALVRARFPEQVYADFDAIPTRTVETLLFLENRELLEADPPTRNPAVEWDRLALAAVTRVARGAGRRSPGGSTLATQIEKFRHSPDGVTSSVREKGRQLATASVRAYLGGPDTTAWRYRLVVSYVNSIPLAAQAGYGEVLGLKDALRVWYGADPAEVDRALHELASRPDDPPTPAQALAYKRVLSLLLAQKRPTHYLVDDPAALLELTDAHLRLLADQGVVPGALRDAALPLSLDPDAHPDEALAVPFAERKTAMAMRARLLPLLGLERLYDADRLDLDVWSTLDLPAQQGVLQALRELRDPAVADAAGRSAHRLVARGDPGQVIYSVTLFEHVDGVNRVRVQADNHDQPLDINEGVKLELGSTAKLRTLASYLEVVAALHEQYAALPPEALAQIEVDPLDALTRWSLDHLARHPDADLAAMLEAALERTYSASPAERFFTGGGEHRFHNFDAADNGRRPTVRQAFHASTNLVFVRVMRDVVRYHMFRLPGAGPRILADAGDPGRAAYLQRFADEEGATYLRGFHRRYRDLEPAGRLDALVAARRATPLRLAVCFRAVRPGDDRAALRAFLEARLPGSQLDDETVDRLYADHGPDRWGLPDQGYLAGVHPLELWLVAYLEGHPDASLDEVLEASADERQLVYGWLFRTRRKHAQDARIRTLLEQEAFLEIHRSWARLGYPFPTLIPSYATALGSSGDRPAALAELVGIIARGGVRHPTVHIERLHFAEDTPYETVAVRTPAGSERVMAPEVAAALRGAMVGVVERGTARRVAGAFVGPDGRPLAVGGKTGTGDNRHREYGADGQLVGSRALNRTGTFVFFLGDRFFGTVVAYVPGEQADEFRFTSSLPSQVLRDLAPVIQPLIDRSYEEQPDPPGADVP